MSSPRPPAEKKGREAAASRGWMRFRRERRAGAAFFGQPEVVHSTKNEAARGKLSMFVLSGRQIDLVAGRSISLPADRSRGARRLRRARAATVRTSSRTLFLSCLPHRKHGISTRTTSTRSTRSSSTRSSSTEAATKSTRSSSTGSRSTSTQRRNDRRSNRGSTDKQQGAHFLRDFCAQVGHLCCCVSGYMLFTCCWFLSSISLC